jgi:phosphatidylserine synthase
MYPIPLAGVAIILIPCIIGLGILSFMIHRLAKKDSKQQDTTYKKSFFDAIGSIAYIIMIPITMAIAFDPLYKIVNAISSTTTNFEIVLTLFIIGINFNFYKNLISHSGRNFEPTNRERIFAIFSILAGTIYFSIKLYL